jgi:hypothetical protein
MKRTAKKFLLEIAGAQELRRCKYNSFFGD